MNRRCERAARRAEGFCSVSLRGTATVSLLLLRRSRALLERLHEAHAAVAVQRLARVVRRAEELVASASESPPQTTSRNCDFDAT